MQKTGRFILFIPGFGGAKLHELVASLTAYVDMDPGVSQFVQHQSVAEVLTESAFGRLGADVDAGRAVVDGEDPGVIETSIGGARMVPDVNVNDEWFEPGVDKSV